MSAVATRPAAGREPQLDREPLFFAAVQYERTQVLLPSGWEDVDLYARSGGLHPRDGRWVTSARDFAERYAAGTARLLRHVGMVVDADALDIADITLAAAYADTNV